MINNSNFKFNATYRADFYIKVALQMVKLFKTNGNTPLTCKETGKIIGRNYQRVSVIASHCDLFKVEKKKVDEMFCSIKAIYNPTVFPQKNGKYTVIGGFHIYKDIEKVETDEKYKNYSFLYKTVPIYKTYISLSDEGINLV